MNLNERIVTYACLHGPIFIPGLGQFGPTMTADNVGKTKDLRMILVDGFLLCDIKGIDVAVPLAYVSHVKLGKKVESLKAVKNA